MTDIQWELENVILVIHSNSYASCEEYIKNNFPKNKIIQWTDGSLQVFEENKHYLCVRHVPHFSVEPPKKEGSWRYGPIISKEDAQRLYNRPAISKENGQRLYNYMGAGRPAICGRGATIEPMFPKNCKVSYLNTEHLTDQYHLEYIKRYITPNIDVYDYSLSNIKILGMGKYLPYKITHEETEYLKKCLQASKKYDVCMVGNIYNDGTRRIEKINELKRHGIKVLVVEMVFGKERDIQIGEARILLNIHLFQHWRVYEAIRCERWRAAGMPIISEASIDPAPSGVTECSYEAITATVKSQLAKMKSH
jgi:hypothetical protein